MFYDLINVKIPSKFCKTTKVPTVFVKIHKNIILEYWDWIEQEQWLKDKYEERLNTALKDLYDHMMEFYNKFNKNIENE